MTNISLNDGQLKPRHGHSKVARFTAAMFVWVKTRGRALSNQWENYFTADLRTSFCTDENTHSLLPVSVHAFFCLVSSICTCRRWNRKPLSTYKKAQTAIKHPLCLTHTFTDTNAHTELQCIIKRGARGRYSTRQEREQAGSSVCVCFTRAIVWTISFASFVCYSWAHTPLHVWPALRSH